MKVPTWQAFSVVAAAVLLGACGAEKKDDTADAQPAAVRAVPVASVAVTAQTRAVGVLAPRDEIRLAFKVGGVVDSVRVESGDLVRKGQVLAELKRAEVDASVSQAAEGVEKARRDLDRARQLRSDEVATEEQVQDLTTAYNVARSNVDAARFNARFARIEAPADGIVFERMVEGGELEGMVGIGLGDVGHLLALHRGDELRVDLLARDRLVGDLDTGVLGHELVEKRQQRRMQFGGV